MAISLAEARGIFTKAYMAYYTENAPKEAFLTSFFREQTYSTLEVAVEVERSKEYISADILRGTSGNMNSFTKSSEKTFIPPLYEEMFGQNSLSGYDLAFPSNGKISASALSRLAMKTADMYRKVEEKIRRAAELQCATVLELGTVTTKAGIINYNRQAPSLADVSGSAPWSTAGSDVEQQLIDAGDFLRREGKSTATMLNITMSSLEWKYLQATTYFTTKANYQKVTLLSINMPQKNSEGASYHGQIAAGSYIYNIWVYDGVYQNSSDVWVRYFDEKKVIITPVEGTRFELAYGGVPAVFSAGGADRVGTMEGKFVRYDYIDRAKKAHTFSTSSAPLAVPVSVDMIYTLKTLV